MLKVHVSTQLLLLIILPRYVELSSTQRIKKKLKQREKDQQPLLLQSWTSTKISVDI